MGFPPNLKELISAAPTTSPTGRRTTRPASELGYSPRDLDTGLRETLELAHRLSG